MKKARQKRANNIQFYFDEVPKINKSTETENIMVTKSGGGVTGDGYLMRTEYQIERR